MIAATMRVVDLMDPAISEKQMNRVRDDNETR